MTNEELTAQLPTLITAATTGRSIAISLADRDADRDGALVEIRGIHISLLWENSRVTLETHHSKYGHENIKDIWYSALL